MRRGSRACGPGETRMPVDDRREGRDHVVGEDHRVGEDDPLDGGMRDVALVPERDVFEAGLQIAAQHAREPAELLALDRVALVRHRARALLATRKGSATSPTSVRCRWRISSANVSMLAPIDAHA